MIDFDAITFLQMRLRRDIVNVAAFVRMWSCYGEEAVSS